MVVQTLNTALSRRKSCSGHHGEPSHALIAPEGKKVVGCR